MKADPKHSHRIRMITAVFSDGNKKETGPFHALFPDLSHQTILVSQPFPHPVKGTMVFTVFSPITSEGKITLHTISGRLQKMLWKGQINAGSNEFHFDVGALDLPSGTYFAKFTAREHSIIRKITVIK